MLLQSMAAKLGIVTGRDLAQATREHTSRRTGFVLWIITELAIMATDIAEVIGGAVALQLLFGFPLLIGVLITTFDVLLLLLLTKLGFRKIEAIVACLISIIFFVFAYEVALADPNMGGALFYGTNSDLGKFVDLFDALKNPDIVGNIASPVLSILFAIALLASGQNSTITGTLSGQIVMEGFIHLKMPLWMRRVVTRLIAIVPVIICVILYGGRESAVEDLLLYTQVFLSIALPVSIIPLTLYTSDKKIMELPADEFYYHQIIGLTVIDEQGEELGANDVWVVQRPKKKDVLIPYIESVVQSIDLENGVVQVEIPEGLIDDEN
ncbi:hypothetical protein HW555_014439 [Spodoptera exigua]|uniref:Ribosome maturation factor RimM PRC barrel domain-containing protein n=1 Tax=Spodoptera exigua TaxID=7107 RepID=A0A835KXN6_SPOEX|nr:hypothetical protein HW555_014439 [Spodoptera exigua]